VVTLRTMNYPTDDPAACFKALSAVFPARSAEQMQTLFGPATGRDFAYEIGELGVQRFSEVRKEIEAHCTLEYTDRPTRRYMAGGLAPHIVGYVARIPAERLDEYLARGYARDALIGIDGIERYWETTLAGRPESAVDIVRDGATVRELVRAPAKPSQSVYLTLDRDLQQATQDALRSAFTTSVWGSYSSGAAAVVMDVRTGEVLAIASYPDFDVDAFNPNTSLPDAQGLIASWARDPRRPTFNRATLGIYPAGSVFKIVSMAAAADSGAFELTSRHYCGGVWNGQNIGDIRRTDWIYGTAQRQHGSLTLKQGLTGSCNIWFWHIGWTLNNIDPHIFPDYAKRMGFGQLTGIMGVGEAEGALPDPDAYQRLTGRSYPGSQALNAVIGQGDVLVTPLQIVRMVAAVANGGTLYQPLLVRQTGIIGEPSYVATPTPNGQLGLKPAVLQGLREAMCQVVTNPTIGTAYFVFEDFQGGAVICGKTGTAQSGAGTLPHAWFAAYAGKTADEPEIAVVVVVEKSNEGSFIAAPIVRRIIETYFDLPISPWPAWYGGGLPPPPGVD
jgi:penicillin-binding protein 2